jgi:SAM-dependent methyltransferases
VSARIPGLDISQKLVEKKGMSHHHSHEPAAFLLACLPLLREAAKLGPILDMACGTGRNGLHLAGEGLFVVFMDSSQQALDEVMDRAGAEGSAAVTIPRDLELPETQPLPVATYGGIVVFHYLHRPLFPTLRKAVRPGGVVVYETFTVDQAVLGKPSNPNFLLQPGELPTLFPGWEVLHHDEGERAAPRRFTARLAARKPL